MNGPPTGTVTFLFTDIEGSTKLWEDDAPAMRVALARHDDVLRSAMGEHGGYVFKTVGDAFCVTFTTAPDALEAALEAQRRLLSSEWKQTGPLRVRMALHTGAAEERGRLLRTSPKQGGEAALCSSRRASGALASHPGAGARSTSYGDELEGPRGAAP